MRYVENKYGRRGQAAGDSIIRRMRIACWVPKVTDMQAEHVIVIAFPVHQWFRELSSALRNAYVAYLFGIIDERLYDDA